VIWVYRYVAPGRPEWLATVLVGSFTAANLSGFLHGFVLFCALPLRLGAPFGGFTEIGGMVAAGLWLYLFHVIVLAGYAATQSASAVQRARRVRGLGSRKPAPRGSRSERADDPVDPAPTSSTGPAGASSPAPAAPGPASRPR
jgi:membrane protein